MRSTRRAQRHPERGGVCGARRALVERAECNARRVAGPGIARRQASAHAQQAAVDHRWSSASSAWRDDSSRGRFEEHTRWVSSKARRTRSNSGPAPLSNPVWLHPSPQGPMWTWQCRWCRTPPARYPEMCIVQRPGLSQRDADGSASMRCSTSMRCRGVFQSRPGTGRGGVRCRAACASIGLPSMGWTSGTRPRQPVRTAANGCDRGTFSHGQMSRTIAKIADQPGRLSEPGDHPARIRHLDDLRALGEIDGRTPCRINNLRVFRRTLARAAPRRGASCYHSILGATTWQTTI